MFAVHMCKRVLKRIVYEPQYCAIYWCSLWTVETQSKSKTPVFFPFQMDFFIGIFKGCQSFEAVINHPLQHETNNNKP